MSDPGKPKPKRDPNKPFPKPPKRKRVVLKFAVTAILVVLAFWVITYSMQIGRWPQDWDAVDRVGFVTFSQEQVKEARANLERIDWAKFGEKTKALWDRVPELEKKLEAKLASLRGNTKQEAEDSAAAATEAGAAATGAEEPAAVPPPPPSELELGCESMRDGIRHYRKSLKSQKELKAARADFEKAQRHLEEAEREASAKGDDALVSEIQGYLVECQKYLYDCIHLDKA